MGYYVKIYNDKVSYCTIDEGWTAFLEHNAIVGEQEVDSKVSGYDFNPHFVCIDEKAGRVIASLCKWDDDEESFAKYGEQWFIDKTSAYKFAVRYVECLNDLHHEPE